MKIVVKDLYGNFFSKSPEVGLFNDLSKAKVFNCINEEHAKIIVEKTKEFISNNDLYMEVLDCEEEEAKKSQKDNASCSFKNVKRFEEAI